MILGIVTAIVFAVLSTHAVIGFLTTERQLARIFVKAQVTLCIMFLVQQLFFHIIYPVWLTWDPLYYVIWYFFPTFAHTYCAQYTLCQIMAIVLVKPMITGAKDDGNAAVKYNAVRNTLKRTKRTKKERRALLRAYKP